MSHLNTTKLKGTKTLFLFQCFSRNNDVELATFLLFYCEIQAFVVVFSQVAKFMSEKKDKL